MMVVLSLGAFCLMVTSALFGLHQARVGIERWRTTRNPAAMQAECLKLQAQNDHMLELFQNHDRSLPLPISEHIPLVGGDCGLTLETLSQLAAGDLERGAGTRWHMTSSGSAAAWGQFLAEMEASSRLDELESATWTTDEWTGRSVRGELVLRSLKGDKR